MKFRALGGAERFPGGPPITHSRQFDDGGTGAEFRYGYSAYGPRAGGIRLVRGAVRQEWLRQGGRETVGYPVADEGPTGDQRGRICWFTGGAVVWHPQLGAHWLPKRAAELWARTGGVSSRLGYPVDVTINPAAGLRQSLVAPYLRARFQGGVMHQLSGDTPPFTALRSPRIELDLMKLKITTGAGADPVDRDDVVVVGTVLSPEGAAKSIHAVATGTWKLGHKQTIDSPIASWPMVSAIPDFWPSVSSFVGLFWHNDAARVCQDLVPAAWKLIRERVEEAIGEATERLGQLASIHGTSVSSAVAGGLAAPIATWTLHHFVHWLSRTLGDDLFVPVVLTLELPDAWPEPAAIGRTSVIFSEEVRTTAFDQPARCITHWRFRVNR